MARENTNFTITIESQEISVCYNPHSYASVGYAHFAFISPHNPRRQIPLSETGYRSHFSPRHVIEATPSVEEYAKAVALALLALAKSASHNQNDVTGQMTLL